MTVENFAAIPLVDLGPLFDPTEQGLDQLAAEIGRVYSTVGFGYIVNHGIDPALVEGVFAASARFHALSHQEKMRLEINEHHRGFIPLNTSTDTTTKLENVSKPNQSESFMMMHQRAADDPDVQAGLFLAGPNQWPAGLPGFREAVTAYHDALAELGHKLVGVIAKALNSAAGDLEPFFARPTTFLRLLYYPPQPPQSPDDLYGSAPHTDYGFITILAQDQVGGLQVRNRSGQWIDAPFIPGAFVVNVGDMLHRWSNGYFISTPHRVINRSGRARYSCPFFYDPHINTTIAPLPGCVAADTSARFEPLVYGDFLRAELMANHDQHQARAAK